MTGVRVRENESIESAIRRFKKLCEKAGILAVTTTPEEFDKFIRSEIKIRSQLIKSSGIKPE